MDRDLLVSLLGHGLSLEEIGRQVGRDASTVAYWLRKDGLEANGRAKYAPRGGVEREELEALVREELSTREIAARLGRSQGTVRHWLRQYELRTKAAERPRRTRESRAEAESTVFMECPRHGLTEFWLRPDGYRRCLRCRSEYVSARRRRLKEVLVAEAGGRCELCGYDRCVAAMHFHHLDPAEKRFGMAERGSTRALEAVRAEARKCVLLCSNCHAEVETGVAKLSTVRRSPADG